MIQNIIKTHLKKVQHKITDTKICNISGTNFDFNKFLISALSKEINKDIIVVLENNKEIANFYNHLKYFSYDIDIFKFPSFDIDIYQRVSPNKSILADRISTLINLQTSSNRKIVLTTIDSFIQRIMPKNVLQNRILHLQVDQNISIEKLVSYLVDNNYQKVSNVSMEGEFSLRGGIIDIYCSFNGAFRIDFFDEQIEKIRTIDSVSQRSIKDIQKIKIFPSNEIILNEETITNFKYNYENYFKNSNKELFENLEEGIFPKAIEHYISFFYNETDNITSFLDANLVLPFNFKNKLQDFLDRYQEEYQYRSNIDNTFMAENNILPLEKLFYNKQEILNIITKHKVFYLNSFKTNEEDIYFETINSLLKVKEKTREEKINLEIIINFIKDNPSYQFIIFTFSKNFYETLQEILHKNYVSFSTNLNEEDQVIIINEENLSLQEGFTFQNMIFLNESEITGVKKTFESKRLSSKQIVKNLSTLYKDDIIVHINHGFGRYLGIKTLETNKVEHDYLEILYQKDEKLYLPVENIDLISRYSSFSKEITLDKLGSNLFAKKQAKVKAKIKDIAYDLIKISALRKLKKAPVIEIDKEDYQAFLKEFPFIETEDQKKAINDIINDFVGENPVDRLICGDVGFGKTEIAMRAAFLIANSGYQVAIITPTTLLCNQHFNNFKKRFSNTAITIEMLSRFVRMNKKKQIKEDIKNGKVDIIIGTHALLAKDIKFKKLGLIIVDEEQSFGVSHKEALKNISQEAHILTLSATPIPRTIQLAYKGIKELSLISTPPVAKLPINTYVVPFDLLTIKKAIEKELQREGQIYFVVPRISDIKEIEIILEKLQINLNYVIIHGQMPVNDIEKNMLDFQNNKYQMLISTNIIESGLDLNNVNTIIIYRSEMFGLAQSYQLRGRVGRGKTQSFAYLLYNNNIPLKKVAEKRLQILQNLDYLGASFSLANYDLEIRGAGNLLGEEQSGHIKEIGFDLYQKLLEKEIQSLKQNKSIEENYDNFSPKIYLNIPVLIPKNYIRDIELTMDLYQRIGNINSIQEIEETRDEMIDRFGTLPFQVENLLTSIRLKIYCKKAYIEKVIFAKKGVLMHFYQGSFPSVEKLITYIESKKGLISLRPEGAILLNAIKEEKKQIEDSFIILNEIHNLL